MVGECVLGLFALGQNYVMKLPQVFSPFSRPISSYYKPIRRNLYLQQSRSSSRGGWGGGGGRVEIENVMVPLPLFHILNQV